MSTTPSSLQTAPASLVNPIERASSGRPRPIMMPAIILGLAATFVQVGGLLMPSVERAIALLFLIVIAAVGLVAAARTRRADWFLSTLIVILSMFPNSSVNPALRIVGGGFRVFTREVLGVVSPWDVLLCILLVMTLWMRPSGASLRLRLGRSTDIFLFGIAIVGLAGALNGFVHASFVKYGPTSIRSVVQQSLPTYYLFAGIVIGRLAIVDRQSVRNMLWAVRLSTIAVLFQGAVLLFLSFRDQFSSLHGFLGIPIVLYDQLTILNVFVCFTVARYAAGQKLKLSDWLMLAGGVLFMLMSTRRLVLIMLVFSICLIFVLAVHRGTVIRSVLRMAVGTVVILALVGATASIAAPKLVEAVGQVIQSIDWTSEAGQATGAGGALRSAELQNMYLNLGAGVTPAWVFGRGVGTFWYEFVPTNLKLDVGSAAFGEALLGAGAQGWWPGFHLPFVTALYRFGIIGSLALWLLVMGWVLRWRTLIRDQAGVERSFAVMVIVLVAGMLLGMGESLNAAGPALFGFLIAGLSGLDLIGPSQANTVSLS